MRRGRYRAAGPQLRSSEQRMPVVPGRPSPDYTLLITISPTINTSACPSVFSGRWPPGPPRRLRRLPPHGLIECQYRKYLSGFSNFYPTFFLMSHQEMSSSTKVYITKDLFSHFNARCSFWSEV